MPDAAKRWADELGWLFDDERFKPNSVAQMNPDVIREGVQHLRCLLAENETLDMCLTSTVEHHEAETNALEADRDALVAYVRAKEGYIPAPDARITQNNPGQRLCRLCLPQFLHRLVDYRR